MKRSRRFFTNFVTEYGIKKLKKVKKLEKLKPIVLYTQARHLALTSNEALAE